MLDWDGRQFPISTLDGDVLPDAFVHRAGLLPHLHADMDDVFPKAQAFQGPGDVDPPGEDGPEEFGAALGKLPEKKKDAVVIREDTIHTRGFPIGSRPEKK